MEPPRVAETLLRRVLPSGIVGESILGDAREEYEEQLRTAGRWRADVRYWSHVLRMILNYGGNRRRGRRRKTARAALRLRLRESSLRNVGDDLRWALLRLRRNPGFSIVTVVTLALGIGATTAIFSLVDGVLLRPLPFPQSERLVSVSLTLPGIGLDRMPQSRGTYFAFREHNRVFEELALWRPTMVTVTGMGEPERVEALVVSDGFLAVLEVQPSLGRSFTTEDDLPESPTTLLLGHEYWQTRLAGDPDVVGRALVVNGEPMEVIGILPRGFRFLEAQPSILAPLQLGRTHATVGGFNYPAIARLEEAVSLDEARDDLTRLIPLAIEEYPGGYTLERAGQTGLAPLVHRLKEDVVGGVDRVLWLLLGAVGIVLLIACANVANLLLVRAEGQRREVAVRIALGAGRASLTREQLAESLVLGAGAGVVGLGLAALALRLLHASGSTSVPRLEEVALDPRAFLFAAAVSLAVALGLGLVPALRFQSLLPAPSLKEGGPDGDARRRQRARSGLVITQMALALVLLIGSGLMLRSLRALWQVHPGFQHPEEILTFSLSIPTAEIPSLATVALTQERLASALAALPAVAAVGLSSSVPMDGRGSTNMTHVQDHPEESPPSRRYKFVSPEYFSTMGIPLLAGRPFRWTDVDERRPAAIVNERFAREYWRDPREAIGKQIAQDPEGGWREIVGVVGNVHDDGLDREPRPLVYWPLAVARFWGNDLLVHRTMTFAVRARGLPAVAILEDVRAAVRSANANLPLADVRSQQAILDRSTARTSFVMALLSIAAGLALLLGVVGLYAVVSYAVSTRTRELGLRMAVGARRIDVSVMVLGRGLAHAAGGIALGFGAAAGLSRLFAASLYGVEPLDPLSYAAAAALLTVIALVATYLPARRAASIDPVRALRHE